MNRTKRSNIDALVMRLEIATLGARKAGWHITGQLCGNGWRGYRIEDDGGRLPFGPERMAPKALALMLASTFKLAEYRGQLRGADALADAPVSANTLGEAILDAEVQAWDDLMLALGGCMPNATKRHAEVCSSDICTEPVCCQVKAARKYARAHALAHNERARRNA